jgi:hypothetical protein
VVVEGDGEILSWVPLVCKAYRLAAEKILTAKDAKNGR